MNPAPIKPLISTSDLDVRVGTMSRTWRIRRSSYGCVSIFGDHARSILVGMKKERPYPEEIEG